MRHNPCLYGVYSLVKGTDGKQVTLKQMKGVLKEITVRMHKKGSIQAGLYFQVDIHSFVHITPVKLFIKSPSVTHLFVFIIIYFSGVPSFLKLSCSPCNFLCSVSLGHTLRAPPLQTSKYQVGLNSGLSSLCVLFYDCKCWLYSN